MEIDSKLITKAKIKYENGETEASRTFNVTINNKEDSKTVALTGSDTTGYRVYVNHEITISKDTETDYKNFTGAYYRYVEETNINPETRYF